MASFEKTCGKNGYKIKDGTKFTIKLDGMQLVSAAESCSV